LIEQQLMACKKFHSESDMLVCVCDRIEKRYIELEPVWQRKVVWNTRMQRELIQTILDGFPINPIVLWEVNEGARSVCVDGKNRLSSIYDFKNNKFATTDGKYYNDLDKDIQYSFDKHSLDFRILRGSYWTEAKVRQYFQVIQGGSKLTWPEKINAYSNNFVDVMREVMRNTEGDFKQVLGQHCNDRFDLYNIIANVLSVHKIVYEKYEEATSKRKAADTNYALSKYITNLENFEVTPAELQQLDAFVKKVIKVVGSLQIMQQEEIAATNKSIWYLTEADSNSARSKPGIRDFTSVAYYVSHNYSKTVSMIISELKQVFKKFVTVVQVSQAAQEHSLMKHVRDYYNLYGKNQKQYAWSSVSSRYDIMLQVLKYKEQPLIDL